MNNKSSIVLVITRAEDCKVCQRLEKSGVFEQIENIGEDLLEDVYLINLPQMGIAENLPAIFNIDGLFPNFKCMTQETYKKALSSGSDWESVFNDIRFYNRRMGPNKRLEYFDEYRGKEITLENIMRFCSDSKSSLTDRTTINLPNRKKGGVKSRY
jgi:hypothetical protein